MLFLVGQHWSEPSSVFRPPFSVLRPSSFVLRRVGIEQAGFVDKRAAVTGTPQNEALVQLLIEATSNIRQPY